MRVAGRTAAGLGAAAWLLCAASAASAAGQPDLRPRTGPKAAASPSPSFATPSPPLAAPAPPGGPAGAVAPGALVTLADVKVQGEAPAGARPARARRSWARGRTRGPGLRVEAAPGEALDASWVRRQFMLNGLIGRPIATERISALILLINRAYLQNGYVNSGVLLPRQALPRDGAALSLRLVLGRVVPAAGRGEGVAVAWIKGEPLGLKASYLRDRLPAAGRAPLDALALEREFRLLADDPALRMIDARLSAARKPGEAWLALTAAPAPRLDVYAQVGDSRSPSVGGLRYSGGASFRNPLFSGDVLSVEGGETSGLADVALAYSTPFLWPSTVLDVRMMRDEAAVVDQAVRALGIRSDETAVEVGLTQRVIDEPLSPAAGGAGWRPARNLAVGLRFAARRAYSSLLGQPFSFSPGAVDGITDFDVLRATADFAQRSEREVLALSATASLGLTGTGSDIPGVPRPDPNFRVILVQASYVRRLTAAGLELRARFAGQESSGLLYAQEQLAAGGQDTVRGYRENLLLGDRGVIASLELSCPMGPGGAICAAPAADWRTVRVSLFADGAYLADHLDPQPSPQGLASLGVGLTWTPSTAFSARLTYGGALVPAPLAGPRDLQDEGVAFLVTLHPLEWVRGSR